MRYDAQAAQRRGLEAGLVSGQIYKRTWNGTPIRISVRCTRSLPLAPFRSLKNPRLFAEKAPEGKAGGLRRSDAEKPGRFHENPGQPAGCGADLGAGHVFLRPPGSLFSPALADWYKSHVTAPFRAVRFPNSNHMLVSDCPEKFAEEVGKALGP